MSISQKHYINIQPKISAPLVIHCSQGDTETEITMTVLNGQEVFDCTGYAVSVHGTRSDGTHFGPMVCSVNGSKISFSLTSEMTAAAGSALAEVTVGTAGTANFAILCENAVFPLGVTYSNDVSVYEQILNYVQAAATNSNTLVANETAARVAADTAESSARYAADSSEASTRAAADASLRAAIDAMVSPSGQSVVVDTSLSISGAAADAAVTGQIKYNLSDFNCMDLVDEFMQFKDKITHGITFTWSGRVCHVEGDKAEALSFTELYKNTSALPACIECGVSYEIKCNTTDTNVGLQFLIYKVGEDVEYDLFIHDGILTIPTNATGLIARLRVNEGDSVNGDVTFNIFNTKSNQNLASEVSDCDAEIKKEFNRRSNIIGDVFLNGTKTSVSVIEENGAFTNPAIGSLISDYYKDTENYKYCIIDVENDYYIVTINTSASEYYKYYVIAVNESGVVTALLGESTTAGTKTFNIIIPPNTEKLYILNYVVNVDEISVCSYDPKSIIEMIDGTSSNSMTDEEYNAISTVMQYNRENKYLNVLFLTDTHINDYPNGESYLESAIRLSKTGLFDSCIHGGDMFSSYKTVDEEDIGYTWNEYIHAFTKALVRFRNIENVQIIKGNHDEGHNADASNNATQYQFSMVHTNPNAVYNSDDPFGNYYYVDYTKEKIRCIILDSFKGELKSTGKSWMKMSDKEVDWLKNIAFNLPDGFYAVIFTHYYDSTVSNYQTREDGSTTEDSAEDVIKKFHVNYPDRFIGVIKGHKHAHTLNITDGYYEIGVTRSYDESDRNGGYSLFTFDTDAKTIHETVIGYGENKDYLTWNTPVETN